ncbi:hypothetical protein GOODEAATRI_032591, partial [Goodea atripinnis]
PDTLDHHILRAVPEWNAGGLHTYLLTQNLSVITAPRALASPKRMNQTGHSKLRRPSRPPGRTLAGTSNSSVPYNAQPLEC